MAKFLFIYIKKGMKIRTQLVWGRFEAMRSIIDQKKKKKTERKGKEKGEKGRGPEKSEGGERECESTWEQGRVAVG